MISITLTNAITNRKCPVNMEYYLYIDLVPLPGGVPIIGEQIPTASKIYFLEGKFVLVKETPEEIQALIDTENQQTNRKK